MHPQRQIDFKQYRNNTKASSPDVTHSGNTKKSSETAFLTKLFQRLNDNNIHYCVLRNYESLPYNLNGSDIDLLVDHDQVKTLLNVLNEETANTGGKLIVFYRSGDFFRLCFCFSGNRLSWGVQFDVHTNELYRGVPFFDRNLMLNRANKFNGISVASPNDAMILALLKECLSNGTSRKGYEHKAKLAYAEEKCLYQNMFEHYFGKDVALEWNSFFSRKFSSRDLKIISRKSRISLLVNAFCADPLCTIRKKIKYHSDRLLRLFVPIGFTLAVLGTDGSGKSTIIEGIRPPLESALHTSLNYEHMRPNLLPSIAHLFGRQTKEGPVTNPHGSRPSGFLGSFLRLSYYSLDYILGYWLKVYPAKVKRPCLYVFDRYFYDFITDPTRSRISLPKWLIKLFVVLIPAPDIVLCLGADPAVIHSRKPELPLIEVERQVRELKKFCDSSPRAVWIDTAQSIEKSVDQALGAITDRMAARYE